MILRGTTADAEINRVTAVEAEETGQFSFPYLRLTDEHFEVLIYSLFKKSAPAGWGRTWDDAALMVRGADAGRDVLLISTNQAVGMVQCKRLESGITLPAVFREISKLILFARVNGDLAFDTAMTYVLALARDPAGTVVEFFSRRHEVEAKRRDDLLAAAREVQEEYATLAGLTTDDAEQEVLRVFPTLSLKLLRPIDLDEWLVRETMVSARFFRQRMVVDATMVTQNQQELLAMLRFMAGKIEAVPLLTDDDLKIIKDRIEQTPESHRLNLGIASLFGYPREMFVANADLRRRGERLSELLRDLDGDYIQWIFSQSAAMADSVNDDAEVMFKVHPFARQIPRAFMSLVASECAAAATSGTVMAGIVSQVTKQPIFEDDTARLARVCEQLVDSGERYLAGDFRQLLGSAEIVAFKRRVISAMMRGLSTKDDILRILEIGRAVLKPKLDRAAKRLRDMCSYRTSIFLMGTGGIDDSNAVKRMAETIKALDAMRETADKSTTEPREGKT